VRGDALVHDGQLIRRLPGAVLRDELRALTQDDLT
jgi:hypothetical protein